MSEHARLSPSSASRWMTCPGSVVLSSGIENRSSKFADEGTQAHALAEKLLNREVIDPAPTAEMWDSVRVYTNHVGSLGTAYGAVTHIEQRVHVTADTWGTADAIVWRPDLETLFDVDLKYGAGVPVEVEDNAQLKCYALGALLTMKYPAKRVNIGIVQPRCPHPDGPIRSVEFDVVDLFEFHADIVLAQERVARASYAHGRTPSLDNWNDAYLTLSEKGCRWCPASAICPKQKDKAYETAKQVFSMSLPYDPKALADTLEYLPILEGWVKNVREFAYAEAEKGNYPPRHKLVQKRATRKWRDVTEAASALQALGIEPYEAPDLLSPAAIEKILDKEQRPILESLCSKESTGHTLVHESDKRVAIRVDAASAFTGV